MSVRQDKSFSATTVTGTPYEGTMPFRKSPVLRQVAKAFEVDTLAVIDDVDASTKREERRYHGKRRVAFVSATDLLELISTKQISPVELTELYFRRIDRLDSQLNSFLLLTHDEAMETAKAAEETVIRGDELGALHGLPISIKDTQMTRGVRTTSGSLVFKDRIPERDAAVVERVRDAGAIILGKTNVPEFGMVGTSENRLGDPGCNPWNTSLYAGRVPSGGSAAAVAAYLCPLATGSDGVEGPSAYLPTSAASTVSSPHRAEYQATLARKAIRCPTYSPRTGPLAAPCGTRPYCSRLLPGTTRETPFHSGKFHPISSPQ